MPSVSACAVRRAYLLLAALVAAATHAAQPAESPARRELTLAAAQQLALEAQPLVEAQRAVRDALKDRAIAARQLPDPELQAGINELPINGADAWSASRDSDTDYMVGFMQEFPRRAKRRLLGERGELLASQSQVELEELELRIRRDAGLAFLDAHHAERTAELAQRQAREALLERDAAEARVRSGTGSQAEYLTLSVEAEVLRDRGVERRQAAARARRQLSRWIGADAERPLLPPHENGAPVPSLEILMTALEEHPAMQTLAQAEGVADADVALARQAYRPDWRLEIGYGHRPEFSEMLTVRAAIDLPFFRRNRQDRATAAARRELAAAGARREDRLRELTASLAAAHDEWRFLGERSETFTKNVLPQARARVDATTAAYRAGRGPLADALAARRALLEVELQALDLEIEHEHRRVELEYFDGRGAHP